MQQLGWVLGSVAGNSSAADRNQLDSWNSSDLNDAYEAREKGRKNQNFHHNQIGGKRRKLSKLGAWFFNDICFATSKALNNEVTPGTSSRALAIKHANQQSP